MEILLTLLVISAVVLGIAVALACFSSAIAHTAPHEVVRRTRAQLEQTQVQAHQALYQESKRYRQELLDVYLSHQQRR